MSTDAPTTESPDASATKEPQAPATSSELSAVRLVDVPKGLRLSRHLISSAESQEIQDDDLIVTPRLLKANPTLVRPLRVRGRGEARDVGA